MQVSCGFGCERTEVAVESLERQTDRMDFTRAALSTAGFEASVPFSELSTADMPRGPGVYPRRRRRGLGTSLGAKKAHRPLSRRWAFV